MTSTNDSSTDHPSRAFPRVLIIGLDGATFDVLGPLMEHGKMPVLKSLVEGGTWGLLESTRPPITPAAWTTFMTGKGPGKHGIVDFLRYNPEQNELSFNNNQRISQQTIWQILSAKNYKVGSVHLPMTFPPEPVNGFMISGFDTPPDENFTYPESLQAELLERYPDYTHEKKWERRAGGGDDLFERNLDFISQSFDRGYELAKFCGERYGWDVMMVLLKLVDNLQHKAWRYIDPRTRDRSPKRRKLTIECLMKLDVSLGKLRALAEDHGASIMIMSDHGHGSLDGKAQPNLLLSKWGYLGLRSSFSQAKSRTSLWWERLVRSKGSAPSAQAGALDHDLAFDWGKTKACVLHAGIYGFLYLNLKGRQPGGIVEPSEFESLRDEIRRRLLDATSKDRDGNLMKIFPEVLTPEEVYGCNRQDYPWMPDLLLVPAEGLAVVKKIRSRSPVRWVPLHRLEGTHRLHGVFVANGPTIAKGKQIHGACIADITPTILAGLGERVPQDMDGKVLREIFDMPISVEYEPPAKRRFDESAEPSLTEEQMQEVASRLGDLGYLD